MSKPVVESEVFEDGQMGRLCGVRKDMYTESEAREIAKCRLYSDDVKLTEQYSFMYHGYGKGFDDEYANTWWLTDEAKKNAIPVYAFREVWE